MQEITLTVTHRSRSFAVCDLFEIALAMHLGSRFFDLARHGRSQRRLLRSGVLLLLSFPASGARPQALYRLSTYQVRSFLAHPTSSSSRCARFCSTDCSKKEWPDHQAFCRAFKAVREQPKTLPPSYSVDCTARRETHKSLWLLEDQLLEAALGRAPTVLEGESGGGV